MFFCCFVVVVVVPAGTIFLEVAGDVIPVYSSYPSCEGTRLSTWKIVLTFDPLGVQTLEEI
jgi:hypothetical protein